jgi:predicted dinucleotide-binding enzyme
MNMKIAVIGAGKIGGTIGGKWEKAGHDVVYGLRDPAKKPGAKTIAQSLKGAEVVLFATPARAVEELVHDHANELDHKILIDATNNFGGDKFNQWPLLTEAMPHAQLYRAFNSYGYEVFADAKIGGAQPDLFYAGPEGVSNDKVERLIKDVGLNPVWVGGTDQAETVDGVLRLWVSLSRRHGRRSAFKLLTD